MGGTHTIGSAVILTPLETEAAWLRRALPSVPVTTIGMRAVSMPPARRLLEHSVSLVVVAGFGGGIAQELRCGAVVVDGPPEGFSPPPSCVVGAIHTADAIVPTPSAKAALHARTGALVVDMELGIVRKALCGWPVRVVGVRAVLDTASQTLPAWLGDVVGPTGSPRVGALSAAVARRPTRALDLARVGVASRRAGTGLAAVVSRLLRSAVCDTGTGPARGARADGTGVGGSAS